MTDKVSFKINENGLVCVDKITTKTSEYINEEHTYKLTYHDWVGYLTIIFD